MRYKEFIKEGIDLAPLGCEMRPGRSDYFCTPRNARVIGWAGVDGIHYCFVPGFGETVFAVSPMNEPGNYVHPIAQSWEDLLRLLLACGSMDALEQAHQWSKEQFDAFLAEYPPTADQQAVLDTIREQFDLEPLKDPYLYIREIQAGFDYSEIRFKEEYYDLVPDSVKPAWKVTYHGGFWGRDGACGKEIPIGKVFQWGGFTWRIPAVYACSEGLVLDFCAEVEPEKIGAFLEKWYPIIGNDPRISREVREQVKQENPATLPRYRALLTVDGGQFQEEGCSGIQWIPEDCLQGDMENTPEAGDLVSHYALDPSRGWVFRRARFPWEHPVEVHGLTLELKALPQAIPGIRFSTPSIGDEIRFTHPVHGTEHLLTVTGAEQAQLDKDSLDNMWELPVHYSQFTYSLSPDLSNRQLRIRDTAQSDEPRLISKPSEGFAGAASIGIIGGSDGPTAIIFTRKDEPSVHCACSSLHFAPVENVLWEMEFYEKLWEDLLVSLC